MHSDESSHVERQNVSFKFSKISSKTLTGNRLNESNEKDYVIALDKSEIKSTFAKPKSKDLVIPLIKKNNWRVSDASQDGLTEEERKLKDLAVKELLKESSEENAKWDQRSSGTLINIPLILQNKIPEGFETDNHMDVSLRAEESTLEDYDSVPIEQFGLAILRGMGWKEGDAIGANNKKCAAPIQVQLRPKGLGLGADTSALKKAQGKMKEEKLELVKGSYATIIQGPHKGFYGQVLGLDEENARAIVKLSSDDTVQTFPEFFLRVVSKKEFDKESRIINRASYENFKRLKETEDEKHKHSSRDEKEDRKRSRDSSSNKEKDLRSSDKHSKKQYHSRDKSLEYQSSNNSSKMAKLWVKPQLRVRLIDDKYKKGRYFNQKVVVVDVLSSDCCSCKTEDDKYLDDISPSMLETVIPRHESSYVMVVKGKYCGELCTILHRDKSKCVATVQFLSDRNQALKIEYDSICEFVGDVAQFD